MPTPTLTKMSVVALIVLACATPASAPTSVPTTTPPSTAAPPVATSPATAPPSDPAGATPAPIGEIPYLCDVLIPADLNAVTGHDYGTGDIDSVGRCQWEIEGARDEGPVIIGDIDGFELDGVRSAYGTGGVDLTVGGRAAFYNPTYSPVPPSLWVDIGDGRTFVLRFAGFGDLDPSYQPMAVQLAEIALGRM